MADSTGIEWTDATWNPTTGCTAVSAGCDNCYAERLANRLHQDTYTQKLPVVDTEENREDPFAVRTWPDRLSVPEKWSSPRHVFVNSMSDLFHKDIPESFVREVFEVMLRVDRHVYQILTKRPARAARFFNEKHNDLVPGDRLPDHIWIGTSVENQEVDYRIRHLTAVPASVRFLSCEPLIGSLDLSPFLAHRNGRGAGPADGDHIHWVIVGGESGPGNRDIDQEWVRLLRDQCLDAGIPFFFKQWGGWTPKANGRTLDGETWNQMPQVGPVARSTTGSVVEPAAVA